MAAGWSRRCEPEDLILSALDRTVAPYERGADLAEILEAVLSEHFGSPQIILDARRQPSEHSSSYETEIVTVALQGRGELRLFLKDFGARIYAKDSMIQRRSRELRVYRDLLSAADLGTPAYYGAAWDEERGRFWLLLDFVEGMQVKHREFPEWVRAAAWLGRMQAHFAESQGLLTASEFLIRQDPDFFRSTAELARRAVATALPRLAGRLDGALAGYEEATELMAAQPRTLVHGGYRPQNIILTGPPQAPRICPADWEEAAFGSFFYDLAYFCDGFEGDRLAILLDAYRSEAERNGFRPPAGPDADRLLALFNLHKNLGTLSKAAERSFPEKGIVKLVGMVESAAGRALSGG
jgi:aminoglycoside phosphotransferase (APT) family kinase protein